ncbi:DUF6415 family natural product biosynthesis protein [Streptomyces atratus]|jgi:hypothetical protein|uniref:Uncharacterized protein n=1 Tax=Streptomyces atratus TaxID=1893 RepID=A0A1K1UHF5_STRAR|nr:DUF6415 family natural product biosynthesis protein [Streptomyces atratus]SFX11797.1 hypothetical protein SAMN02787144_1001548 [Streptomyces atratus]
MTDPTPTRPSEPAAKAEVPHAADLPLDVEAAAQAADDALRLRLGTTTRREIDTWTAELRGRISLFAEEVLNHPQTTATRAALWEVDQLLASAPKDDILVFSSYQYLCDLARMLRRLVAEHRKRTETALVGSTPEHMTMSSESGNRNGT